MQFWVYERFGGSGLYQIDIMCSGHLVPARHLVPEQDREGRLEIECYRVTVGDKPLKTFGVIGLPGIVAIELKAKRGRKILRTTVIVQDRLLVRKRVSVCFIMEHRIVIGSHF